MQNRNLGAAALAAAFVILHDTVGSGPTFRKGQTVPAEDLEFLGVARLLAAGAIRPVEEAAPEAETPASAGMDLSELAAEAADRGYVLVLQDEREAEQAALAQALAERERLETALAAEQEGRRKDFSELTESLRRYSEHNQELETELANLRQQATGRAEPTETESQSAVIDPAPAKSTRAKKGE